MSKNPLTSILDQNKLTGPNYVDWVRNLRIVLNCEKKAYVLDAPMPEKPADDAANEVLTKYQSHMDDDLQVRCYMLASMSNELQRQNEGVATAYEVLLRLQRLYGESVRQQRYTISKELFQCRMTEGSSVQTHGLKMIALMERLGSLGVEIEAELQTDLMLQSLPPSFDTFVVNFTMHSMTTSLPELVNMLVTAESTMKKDKPLLLVGSSSSSKAPKAKTSKWKGKEKMKGSSNPNKLKAQGGVGKKKGESSQSNDNCHFCKKPGHWKRNCKEYLASLKRSGMYFVEVNLSVNDASWVLDTGCSSHLCNDLQVMVETKKLSKGETVLRMGNGARVAALVVGTVHLALDSGFEIVLNNCFYVPSLIKNIISIPVLDRESFEFSIKGGICSIFKDASLIYSSTLLNGLYTIMPRNPILHIQQRKRKLDDRSSIDLWHSRLGHISERRMNQLSQFLGLSTEEKMATCESCLKGKMTKSPFVGQVDRSQHILDLIHTDVCGPLSVGARGNYHYFVTFTDDYSRYGYVYLLRHKSEVFEKFKEFRHEVEKQTGSSIKILRSDRGGEYLSGVFLDYLKENGILSQWTPPGTPQLNGVSERRNRTLLDMVRSMMGFTTLPLSFWGYALETATHLLNRVPSKAVPKTPYELWFDKTPSYKYLRIWGCTAYVKQLMGDKLDMRSILCNFVGYPRESIGYYFYDPSEQKVFVSRNATFLEEEFLCNRSNKIVELDETQEPQSAPVVAESTQSTKGETSYTQPREKSKRVSRPPDRLNLLVENNNDEQPMDNDPRTFSEAIKDVDSDKWLEAMQSEIESMYFNKVWILVDQPSGIVPIGCKWIFKRKLGADGNVATFKARLVAKGYTQKQGIDYEETFSPVAMLKSIRTLLAIAAYYDYEIWQMDVKTAFLNGNIKEDIYMMQPEGYVSKGNEQKVCKLQRSIYGLKQASRSWNIRFDETIKAFDFHKNPEEPCVYKKVSGSAVVFVVLYVDDILVIGNDIGMMQSTRIWLSKQFSMKDLGDASFILGIKIYRDRSRRMIGLSQSMYIDKMLKRFCMEESRRGFLPMSHGISLSKAMSPQTPEGREKMTRVPYASAIGSIMYAMLCTRPDVAHALSVTSRYQSNPGEEHWKVVKSILKYLRRTKDLFLIYGGGELKLEGFTDSSFQSDKDDSKSMSGFIFTLNGGAICWKSSKQETVADSTTEAEYIAASDAAKEAVWIRNFIQELGVIPSSVDPVPIYCDNNGAIAQAKEPRSHQRSKHIMRRYHLIREIIGRGDVVVERVASAENVADPLTKPLSQKVFEGHLDKMGLRYAGDWC